MYTCTCIHQFVCLLFPVFFHLFLPFFLTKGTPSLFLHCFVHWPSQRSWCTEVAQLRKAHFACYKQHDGHHEMESSGNANTPSHFTWVRSDGFRPEARVGSHFGTKSRADGSILEVVCPRRQWSSQCLNSAAKRLMQRHTVDGPLQSGCFLHRGWSAFKPWIQARVHTMKSNNCLCWVQASDSLVSCDLIVDHSSYVISMI